VLGKCDGHALETEFCGAIFDFIEDWYKPRRRHSAPDYLSPIAYEKRERSSVGSRKR